MPVDPWSRPTHDELFGLSDGGGCPTEENRRAAIRRPLRVPAELITGRGNAVPAMTRDFSASGVGLVHRGAVPLGEGWLQLAGDTAASRRRICITWCVPCANGMFFCGGRLLTDRNGSENR